MTVWPELTIDDWRDTKDAVHMWTQIVGKVRMALEPLVNHWWNVTLYVSVRGLTTSMMPTPHGGLEIEFDFDEHVLRLTHTSGSERVIALRSMSVADFYREVMAALAELGVDVAIQARPNEVPVSIPFADDTEVRPYDADAVRRFWLALVEIDRVLHEFRGRFRGKASPVHFFWGGFDMAATRFSGRVAPPHPGGVPNCADWVMLEAYSDEVSSCGYWPDGSEEGSFYAYAYPEPDGFREWAIQPAAASYSEEYGEFLLPYRDVRLSDDPDAMLLTFLQSAFDAAAVNAQWPQ
ncbi:MAG: hypothetical protein QOF21_427 [Actinomycetota bacterium]|jgi:hypothetical protein